MNKHILIVGGGFAGLWAALAAARVADSAGGGIHITLASRDAYLTLRPACTKRIRRTCASPCGRCWRRPAWPCAWAS